MAAAALIFSTTQWTQDVTQLDNLLADHQSGYTPVNIKGEVSGKIWNLLTSPLSRNLVVDNKVSKESTLGPRCIFGRMG